MAFKIYRARYNILSAQISAFDSDTIFGIFCWFIRYTYGEDKLLSYIKMWKVPEYNIVFSNGFVNGYIDKVYFPSIGREAEREISEDASKIKEARKRMRFSVEEEIISESGKKIPIQKHLKAKMALLVAGGNDNERYSLTASVSSHNTIDRHTLSVKDDGGFFFQEEKWPRLGKDEQDFVDFYVKYDEACFTLNGKNIVEEFLNNYLPMKGFGADVSTGKGRLSLQSFDDVSSKFQSGESGYIISLSNGVPCANIKNGYYDIFTKYGKLGEHFALKLSYEKYPITMLRAGSVFKVDEKKEIYGKILTGVHEEDENIIQSALVFPVHFKPEEELF